MPGRVCKSLPCSARITCLWSGGFSISLREKKRGAYGGCVYLDRSFPSPTQKSWSLLSGSRFEVCIRVSKPLVYGRVCRSANEKAIKGCQPLNDVCPRAPVKTFRPLHKTAYDSRVMAQHRLARYWRTAGLRSWIMELIRVGLIVIYRMSSKLKEVYWNNGDGLLPVALSQLHICTWLWPKLLSIIYGGNPEKLWLDPIILVCRINIQRRIFYQILPI